MLVSQSRSQDRRFALQDVPFVPFDKQKKTEETRLTTRIAPSPTGDMHLGTARTAYFNWLAARATGGHFILRIDDTDPERSKPEYTTVILETMEWLGLTADHVFYQSRRYHHYYNFIKLLKAEGNDIREKDGAVFLHEHEMPESWKDELAGEVAISKTDRAYLSENGLVLLRKPDASGIVHPTYHFASVVDDILMGINCIIRGVDHTANVAKQLAIYTALGVAAPKYYHIGLIKKDGKKLSKRDGAASMLQYREQGVHPDALLNFMARIGWGPSKDDASTATLTREDMLRMFWAEGRMRASDANMDLQKLAWYHKKYKAMDYKTYPCD